VVSVAGKIAKYAKYTGIGIVHFLSCMGYMFYPVEGTCILFGYICFDFYVGRHIKSDEDEWVVQMALLVIFGVVMLIGHIFGVKEWVMGER
jgi:hypothetical protein